MDCIDYRKARSVKVIDSSSKSSKSYLTGSQGHPTLDMLYAGYCRSWFGCSTQSSLDSSMTTFVSDCETYCSTVQLLVTKRIAIELTESLQVEDIIAEIVTLFYWATR